MYNPSFRTRSNNVPILSKLEIEAISERFIEDFCPEALIDPRPIDVDRFVESYLGMTLDYQFLSSDGRYLGMTVFNDTDRVIIFDPLNRQADYLHADARTVIIDNTLLAANQAHRYRYTMGHEAGHDIFHSAYYYYDPNQGTLFDGIFEEERTPMVQCRINSIDRILQPGSIRKWTDEEWMEWQANYFSSTLLMPKPAVLKLTESYRKRNAHDGIIIATVSNTFDVSEEAATYRCRELNILHESDYRLTGCVGLI